MHPITRREKLKKDLTDLNYFAKKVIFRWKSLCMVNCIAVGLIERSELWMEED